jgi:LuxR family maltose regulon positive regulatory protein
VPVTTATTETTNASHVIDRPRLLSRLTRGAEAGTVLVAATAGWGKTLLVASWISAGADDRLTVRVSLDRADDERVFWRTVATALLDVADEPARHLLRRMACADTADLPSLLVAAVRQLHRKVVLVLDDLHEVRTPELHDGLLRLVERPLPSLSLIVTTRCDPPWPLERLRLAGVLTEVRAADLAFRIDEASLLLTGTGLRLSEEEVKRLVERTEGWAAGLRLAALHLRTCDDVESAVEAFSGDDHSVAGYLLTEVLDRQAPELLGFLESVSVVDEVNAALADALTGGSGGEAKLAELAATLLLVEVVGRPGRWYRLHRMVADILRARPVPRRRHRDLHRRAAEWFRDHDMPLDAVRLALRGELWSLAAELVGRYLVSITLRGGAHRLERLLTDVPRTTVLSRPELTAGLAGARVVQGSAQEVAALVDMAQDGVPGLSPVRAERLEVVLDLMRGALARIAGDFGTMQTVYRRVPREPAALARLGMAAGEIVPIVALNNLGTAELWNGDLSGAAAHLAATIDLGTDGPTLPHLNAAAHLALLHCERGEFAAAETAARAVTTTAERLGWAVTPQAVSAYLAMARVLLDRAELTDLDQWLRRVAEVEAVAPERPIQLAAALLLAARRESAGDAERALTGLRAAREQLEPWTPPRDLAERCVRTEATLLIRLGDPVGARRLLSGLGPPRTDLAAIALARVRLRLGDVPTPPAVSDGGVRARVGAHLVEALQASAAGTPERGLEPLEEALRIAAPSRLRRPFLVDSTELGPLLRHRVERGSAVVTFALDLLQRMSDNGVDDPAALRAVIDPLTAREQTILRYLSSTLSNTEIANELYLSVNTVKTHQRTIYRKLGAAGRREAVRRARELHLL